MARVQIPAGAFSERSEVKSPEGFELRETIEASLAIEFTIPAGAALQRELLR